MSAPRRAILAGWTGAGNLGDELLARAAVHRLRRHGVEPIVVSLDPAGTERTHDVTALDHRDPRALVRALRGAELLLLGPGGLLQDETSALSLPRHLHRVALARARGVPVAGIGLGAGPLTTTAGRWMVRRALSAARQVVVRDRASARLLEECGLSRVEVTADWAFSLEPPRVAPVDRVVVCLRPYAGRGRVLPSHRRDARDPRGPARVAALATALDRIAADTGWPVHLLALEPRRDGPFHRAVAAAMRAPTTLATPGLDDVFDEIAAARLVVVMRYHALVGALVAGRPAVAIGYAPKVGALAADAGSAVTLVGDDPTGWGRVAEAAGRVLGRDADAAAAGSRLRAREGRNDELLAALLG